LELPTCNIHMRVELQHIPSWSCLSDLFHDVCLYALANIHSDFIIHYFYLWLQKLDNESCL
jgi:hypothetical protein